MFNAYIFYFFFRFHRERFILNFLKFHSHILASRRAAFIYHKIQSYIINRDVFFILNVDFCTSIENN